MTNGSHMSIFMLYSNYFVFRVQVVPVIQNPANRNYLPPETLCFAAAMLWSAHDKIRTRVLRKSAPFIVKMDGYPSFNTDGNVFNSYIVDFHTD